MMPETSNTTCFVCHQHIAGVQCCSVTNGAVCLIACDKWGRLPMSVFSRCTAPLRVTNGGVVHLTLCGLRRRLNSDRQ